MAMILVWFLYLSIALKIGRRIFSAKGLEPLNSGILRFFTALEKKKEFRSFALPLFSLAFLLSSTIVIYSSDFDLSENNGMKDLQNCLLSATTL